MDLSIIIPSYNTKDYLLRCINSIKKNTLGIKYELIIVDNGSVDGSKEVLQRLESKDLAVIFNKENVGFAGANNLGFEKASGNYILYLNSDTLVTTNVLGEMVQWMKENPKVGVVSSALGGKDGKLQATGGYFPTLSRVFLWMLGIDDIPFLGRFIKSFHPHTPDYFGNSSYLFSHEQDWVTGAFFLTRSRLMKIIGEWDEEYFMYVEEVDLCFRIKKNGWKIMYLPQWKVVHYGGASSRKEFPILSEYQGLKRFYTKFYPRWNYLVLRVLLKVGAIGRIILFGILGRKETVGIYAKAFKTV